MSDAEWDADDFEPPVPGVKPSAAATAPALVTDRWEGEDEEDELKDNWDDEEEEDTKKKIVNGEGGDPNRATQVKKKKPLAERIAEKEAQKKAEAEEKRKREQENQQKMSAEELAAEKLRQKKIVEDADLEIAAETFGLTKNALATNIIDNFEPQLREEFDKLSELLRNKLTQYDKSPHYVNFLDVLFRDLCVSLEVEDIKKLGSTINALGNEKQKQAKASTKGKKKTKAKVNAGRDDNYDDMMVSGHDEFDDFM